MLDLVGTKPVSDKDVDVRVKLNITRPASGCTHKEFRIREWICLF
ncbi:hypothetical protein Desti_4321 [Desulfomonile tiedjei DSM 6799]|uniref:Uncharacterized protein n=1 Tax=Desulfomonile tiedjei (strain ATCC 49306 / DSM 6799 / DCB-1) TaxID=706587 RepID=I4CBL3_DESTA|nr:hypothetical protein Desti_4321 [Desulfomonile tiedjei DSM 6799]